MPELPEVETTVKGLNRAIKGLVVSDIWTNYTSAYHLGKDNIKDKTFLASFKKIVKGSTILKAERRAKNILIHLSTGHTLLIHMKMTGHILYGTYKQDSKPEHSKDPWKPTTLGPLADPFNRFIRLVFIFSNGKHLALSDMRRFAKVTLIETDQLERSTHLLHIGPEPLTSSFTFNVFMQQLSKKPQGKIKTVLMDQSIIAGVGNIYSDEALWRAGINPEEKVSTIPAKYLKKIFTSLLEVLKSGIDFGGDSMSDYRNIKGERGEFQEHHRAYRRTGKLCDKKGCKGIITRKVVGGRSAHFCNVHQILLTKHS